MSGIDNNIFEVKPNSKSKRKITTPCPNAYLNPALDLLANEDPMCNTAMEIVPIKKRKRSRSCDIAAFENTGLDLGISKAAVNAFLVRELENVRQNMKCASPIVERENNAPAAATEAVIERQNFATIMETEPVIGRESVTSITDIEPVIERENIPITEPVYANLTDLSVPQASCPDESIVEMNPTPCNDLSGFNPDFSEIEMDSGISVLEQKSLTTTNTISQMNNLTDISGNATSVTNKVIINNTSQINLSFIDRLALDSPNLSNQSLYLDDDLNESNIMEVKTITIITKKKRIISKKKNTNPFLDPNLNIEPSEDYSKESCNETQNPFLTLDSTKPDLEYNDEVMSRPAEVPTPQGSNLMPRRLFSGDTNSTISTMNESMNVDQHEYENIDGYRSESPIYENVSGDSIDSAYNKQSKILGHDVSRFSAIDIMNLNKHSEANSSNESNDSKKDLKYQLLKAGNKLSKKVFKTLKKTFKHDKVEHNVTLNPYEVPRKLPKQKLPAPKDCGIENPALNLNNSDEIEIEELDDDEEHQYETVKTLRNTQLNMNVTPLKERDENADFSHSRLNTPGKKVRFDSTLNREKVITGNSFDCDIQSPGFDVKIDKYHDELENCINEKKFLQQNM
ncbi:uncharacterized protein LOC135081961 [Ostrinia nubilalis]|uniref:uncharacterized protein LOC135081961 n=1 Tax=Ostrinia nubilalis TaxID=29057 RepID=UPI0030824979